MRKRSARDALQLAFIQLYPTAEPDTGVLDAYGLYPSSFYFIAASPNISASRPLARRRMRSI